jgi:methionyl-tRNA formyltransferase
MILNVYSKTIKRRAILLGDETGIPILNMVASELGLGIMGLGFSKKVSKEIQLKISSELNIPVIQTHNGLNSNQAISEFIKKNSPHIIIMFSYDVILDKTIIDVKDLKIINIHGGKVPSYRGANVLNWAIINGEKEIGVTVHEAQIKVDSGPIIGEWLVGIDNEDTVISVREKISKSVLEYLPQILSDYFLGKIIPKYQSDSGIIAYKKRKPEDGMFDWSFSDENIYNLIRGLVDPWPGARYIDKNGNLVIIKKYMSMEEIELLRESESNWP